MLITNITKIGHSTPLGINIRSNIQIILGIHRMEKRARQITANILMVMEVKTKNQTMRGMNLNLQVGQNRYVDWHHQIPIYFFTEHSSSLDVDATNKKFLARTEELWDSIETSGWWLEDKHEGIFDNKMINGK